jgi:hypothetical protein
MSQTRRAFLKTTGIGLLTFYVAGCKVELTPQEARQQDVPFQVLTADQASILEAFGEVLLPGAAAAGIAHFVDHQLNAEPADQLLMIKYLGVDPPFTGFYTGGLAALDAHAKNAHGLAFSELSGEQQVAMTGQIAQANPEGWAGPPAPFFYFVVRNDAVDVVYGTREGMESLGIPFMAHIEPPSPWGA